MQKYIKRKIRDERGVYIAVYAKTPQELAQKVAERTAEIERRKQQIGRASCRERV